MPVQLSKASPAVWLTLAAVVLPICGAGDQLQADTCADADGAGEGTCQQDSQKPLRKLYAEIQEAITNGTVSNDTGTQEVMLQSLQKVMTSYEQHADAEIVSDVSRSDAEDYQRTYGILYAFGYHSPWELTFSHEGGVINLMSTFLAGRASVGKTEPVIDKVLVLGCSHGWGTHKLSKLGYRSWGVDVAMQAIGTAIGARGRTCGEGTEPCFLQASLTKLPFESNKFDAAISSDVLEHIQPADVPIMAAEVSRVVQRYLFLRIASFPENMGFCDGIDGGNCHRTVENETWWYQQFEPFGWVPLMLSSSGIHPRLNADLILARE